MAMGECSAYSSLQADSMLAACPTCWRPPGVDRLWPRWGGRWNRETWHCETWQSGTRSNSTITQQGPWAELSRSQRSLLNRI